MNFGTPVPLLIGIVLIIGAVALFFLDKIKPGYGRDSDKVYAILWLVSGVFLLGHLTMELLASFQQLIMTGMLIAITIENILSRKPRDDRYAPQAASDAPMRGEPSYRPSRTASYGNSARMNVRAELENEGPPRGRFPTDRRVLSGREEQGGRRSSYYGDDYPDRYGDDRDYGARPNGSSDRPVGRLAPGNDRIRRRRPKSVDSRYGDVSNGGAWDEPSSGYSANSGGYSSHSSDPAPRNGAESDSYVDYRPVDYPSDEPNTPSNPDYGNRY
ncbi:MAG: hypothetical protein F6J95_004565 [Leptolyngbya sp. SIO1E4]|nr:hypothetical protein [Leptolyngbya sp. SIO1E4]